MSRWSQDELCQRYTACFPSSYNVRLLVINHVHHVHRYVSTYRGLQWLLYLRSYWASLILSSYSLTAARERVGLHLEGTQHTKKSQFIQKDTHSFSKLRRYLKKNHHFRNLTKLQLLMISKRTREIIQHFTDQYEAVYKLYKISFCSSFTY